MSHNMYKNYLSHHGILGQKWGHRNGPPYPIGADDHSRSEKRAGWRKSLDKGESTSDNKSKPRISPKTKKAIVAGAAAISTGLALYGAYKMGYFNDSMVSYGQTKVTRVLGDISEQSIGSVVENGIKEGYRKLQQHESIDEIISKINPNGVRDNCYNCVVATTARICGWDVVAKGDTMAGKGMRFGEICKVFGLDPTDENDVLTIFSPTVERLERQIKKRYVEGDVGAIGVNILNFNGRSSGHTLNWIYRNGQVEFLDSQVNRRGSDIRNILERRLDSSAGAEIARFANINNGLDLSKDVDISRFSSMVS